jgi:hypothetical protein
LLYPEEGAPAQEISIMLESFNWAYANMISSKRVARIDADNAQAAVIEGILGEVARFGAATVKRIYGDFTSPCSASWKKILQKYAIKPVQQFAYSTGKNATDSTLIIDAMDLLYTRRFDGFCLVTSDSDFAGLATRIREEGLMVLGFGEQKTPDAFRSACNKFVLRDLLRPAPAETIAARAKSAVAPVLPPAPAVSQAAAHGIPKDFMLSALNQSSDENGWAHLGTFGSYLTKLQPDFDARAYGFRKLSDLVRSHQDIFVTEERAVPGQAQKQPYVKPR